MILRYRYHLASMASDERMYLFKWPRAESYGLKANPFGELRIEVLNHNDEPLSPCNAREPRKHVNERRFRGKKYDIRSL